MEDWSMKKRVFAFAALLVMAACARNQEVDIPEPDLTLFARTEAPADSKTIVESGTHVYWEPGDEIFVFSGEKSAKFVTDITASAATATFKGTFGEETWAEGMDLWAVYPYSEDAVFDGETITTVLPSEQVARAGSFGKDMNLAIAHSTTSTLLFYNVGGGVRFSVTEEGVKKVMFEGLSGEIISGKVKIGLDESGLPVVQEVTGGSQFITLLPPTGQETFEKDTWYYIVAIPGALEGGYKLRFYKDTDYARKVSEKAVTIKRSIYGNIEKADEGIEYEAQRTHFPETEEEWEKSVETTYQVGAEVKRLIYPRDSFLHEVSEQIIEEVQGIDGVLDVWMNLSKTGISVMQKDSVWINFFLDTYDMFDSDGDFSIQDLFSSRMVSSKKNVMNAQESYLLNSKRKALVLDPFYDPDTADWPAIENYLVKAGFDPDNIDGFGNRQVSLGHFRGSFLSQYDLIIIHTHGGTGYNIYKEKNKPGLFDYKSGITTLATPVPYTKELAAALISSNTCTREEIAIVGVDDKLYPDLEYALAITPSFIKDASFNDSCVLLCACHSSELSDKNDAGSMVWRFLKLGAGIVTGNKNSINRAINIPVIKKMLELMSYGVSFQESASYIESSPSTKEYGDKCYEYAHEIDPKRFPESVRYSYEFKNLFQLFENPSHQDIPYFLTYPVPELFDAIVTDSSILLRWETPLSSFDTTWSYYFDYDGSLSFIDSYAVSYDVIINDMLVRADVPENTISWTPDKWGEYSWHVIAKLVKGESVIASYQSAEGHFVISSGGIDDIPGHDI